CSLDSMVSVSQDHLLLLQYLHKERDYLPVLNHRKDFPHTLIVLQLIQRGSHRRIHMIFEFVGLVLIQSACRTGLDLRGTKQVYAVIDSRDDRSLMSY